MRVITKFQANSFSNSPTCTGYEYSIGDKDINSAVVTVNGRYPEKGYVINTVCKEIVYILSGKGSVCVNEKIELLSPGDVTLVEPGKKFYWQGDNLEMLMTCTPAFYPEQHKEVE